MISARVAGVKGRPSALICPRVGRQQSQQHLHRGRLARAVGAEEAVDAPAWHHEVQALDNGALAEGLGEVAGQDDGVVGRRGERGSRLRVGSRLGGCDAGGDDAGCCIRAGLGRLDRLGSEAGAVWSRWAAGGAGVPEGVIGGCDSAVGAGGKRCEVVMGLACSPWSGRSSARGLLLESSGWRGSYPGMKSLLGPPGACCHGGTVRA